MFANEDIYNVAKTKKFYSKGDLVATRTMNEEGKTEDVENLPLGKYIVKEKIASKGYLIDKTTYNVELKYKDQVTPIISDKVTSNEEVKKMQVHIFKSGIKVNSGETPGLEGAEFTIKLNRLVELLNGNKATILDTNNNQYYAEIVNDKGITIDNRAITEDEIKKVLVYKDKIR